MNIINKYECELVEMIQIYGITPPNHPKVKN
jgi:hypothetical protein